MTVPKIFKSSNFYNYLLILVAFIIIPLLLKVISGPGINSIEFVGDFKNCKINECFFSDIRYSFNISGNKIINAYNNKIKFIKPAGVKNPIRTRFHMDPTYSNDIIIDSVIIQYNSGKEISYTAENYFSNIYWLGSNIKNITYAANSAIITFNENIKDESYIELGTDLRFYRYNHYFIITGLMFFLTFLMLTFKINKDEIFLFTVSLIAYFSFFSSILLNNILVISICLLAIYNYFFKGIRNKISLFAIGFSILYALKLIWTFIPVNSHSFSIIMEKYLSYVLLPVAFIFIPISNNNATSICKSMVIVSISLLYINLLSYIVFYPPFLSGHNITYPDALHQFSPEFTHSSYVSFFYITSFIGVLHLYYRNNIKTKLILIYPIIVLIYSILANARIGILFSIISFISSLVLLYYESIYKKYYLPSIIIIVIVFASLVPFSKFLSKIDPIRMNTWEIARENIKNNAFCGLGTGGERLIFNDETLEKYNLDTTNIPRNNAHNQLLNEMLEHGIIFGSILYLIMFTILIIGFKQNKPQLCMFVIIALIFMSAEVVTDRSRGLIFLMTMLLFWDQVPLRIPEEKLE